MGGDNADQDHLAWCVSSVEGILNYNFRNTKLLEDALTHDSFPETTSFQRLEFLGDAALYLAVANFVYLTYPNCPRSQLSLLREANVRTEKLARVAVRNGFHRFVRHSDGALIPRVQEFVAAVMEEDEMLLHGGVVRAPKILADVVESIAGAVYIDCGFDLKALWLVFRGLLEPLITLEILQEYECPMTTLNDLCWAQGKRAEIRFWGADSEHIVGIYVGGELVATAKSTLKESARLSAAREALRTLVPANVYGGGTCGFASEVGERNKVLVAKRKLSNICAKRNWPKPSYRVEKEERQSDVRKYVCSVHVEVEETVLVIHGGVQSTVEDAENSAASFMICSLLTNGHVKRRPIKGALEAVKGVEV